MGSRNVVVCEIDKNLSSDHSILNQHFLVFYLLLYCTIWFKPFRLWMKSSIVIREYSEPAAWAGNFEKKNVGFFSRNFR